MVSGNWFGYFAIIFLCISLSINPLSNLFGFLEKDVFPDELPNFSADVANQFDEGSQDSLGQIVSSSFDGEVEFYNSTVVMELVGSSVLCNWSIRARLNGTVSFYVNLPYFSKNVSQSPLFDWYPLRGGGSYQQAHGIGEFNDTIVEVFFSYNWTGAITTSTFPTPMCHLGNQFWDQSLCFGWLEDAPNTTVTIRYVDAPRPGAFSFPVNRTPSEILADEVGFTLVYQNQSDFPSFSYIHPTSHAVSNIIIYGEGVSLHCLGGFPELSLEAISALEVNRKILDNLMGGIVDIPTIPVYVVPTQFWDNEKAVGYCAWAPTVIGHIQFPYNRFFEFILNPDRTPLFRTIIPHEMTHFIFHHRCFSLDPPSLLDEGLAEYFGWQTVRYAGYEAGYRWHAEGVEYVWETVCNDSMCADYWLWPGNMIDIPNGYAVAWYIIDTIANATEGKAPLQLLMHPEARRTIGCLFWQHSVSPLLAWSELVELLNKINGVDLSTLFVSLGCPINTWTKTTIYLNELIFALLFGVNLIILWRFKKWTSWSFIMLIGFGLILPDQIFLVMIICGIGIWLIINYCVRARNFAEIQLNEKKFLE